MRTEMSARPLGAPRPAEVGGEDDNPSDNHNPREDEQRPTIRPSPEPSGIRAGRRVGPTHQRNGRLGVMMSIIPLRVHPRYDGASRSCTSREVAYAKRYEEAPEGFVSSTSRRRYVAALPFRVA
jgi:hypothetical protein